MRKIVKQKEPKEWTEYRLTPGVEYRPIPELRDALLKEQGYICAYCMRRIPVKDRNSNETTRIDHKLSRKNHPELQLNYTNMAICCPGAIDNDFHCDKLKEENDITFDLSDDRFFETISYSSKDGEIKSSDEEYNRQMNRLLNLNHSLLKRNRLGTLRGVIAMMNKENRKGWTAADIRRMIEIWDNKDSDGQYKPYNGIVLWFLNKRLRQCT